MSSRGESHFYTAPADSTSWMTLIEIDGAIGELIEVGVRNPHGQNTHYFRVTIDDEEITKQRFAGIESFDKSISLNKKFEKSMEVQVRDENPEPRARFTVNYRVYTGWSKRIERVERTVGFDIKLLVGVLALVFAAAGIVLTILIA